MIPPPLKLVSLSQNPATIFIALKYLHLFLSPPFLSSPLMEALKHSIPIFTSYQLSLSSKFLKPSGVWIRPPTPEFDFGLEIMEESKSTVAKSHPGLLDLADNGTLVVVQKTRFGPVPEWRAGFVEPDEIWLVGTLHISPESASAVERVVRTVKPDNVVVELCKSRAGIMYTSDHCESSKGLRSNMFTLTGSGFFGALSRSINLGGQSALALRLLLAIFSSKISSDVNLTFGNEFRVARRVSEEVGAQIVLGDRPIEITLERAWDSLNWNEKFRLVTSIFRGITASSTDISMSNDLKGEEHHKNNISFLYEKLSFSYPALLQPLIHERDTYLAWSLKRSKAVNNSKRVVGVIGKSHMNGVICALTSDQGNLRFSDLAGKRSKDRSKEFISDFLKSLARDTIIGILLWVLYEQIKDVL